MCEDIALRREFEDFRKEIRSHSVTMDAKLWGVVGILLILVIGDLYTQIHRSPIPSPVTEPVMFIFHLIWG